MTGNWHSATRNVDMDKAVVEVNDLLLRVMGVRKAETDWRAVEDNQKASERFASLIISSQFRELRNVRLNGKKRNERFLNSAKFSKTIVITQHYLARFKMLFVIMRFCEHDCEL